METLSRHQGRFWTTAALITAAPLLLSLCWAMWTAPYPISETVGLMELAGVMPDPHPAAHDGIDPVLRNIFSPTARSWYRPFFHLTWYVLWHATGSLSATLLLFRVLEVASVASLILLLLWWLRPQTFIDYAAATFAVAVLLGTPGLRENLEIPMLMTLVAMPMVMIVWMLLERPHVPWHSAVIVLLTMIAIGYKEQGLVLLPVIVAAWWTRAPGASRVATAAAGVVVLAYLAFRFSTTGAWMPFEQDVGLGLGALSAADASSRFGAFPYWMYLYNAASTVSNILFSEPTAGTFRILRDIRDAKLASWEINELVSSAVLTALVIWWGVRTWRRERGAPWSVETRLVLVSVFAIAASGALGFNYSRDRMGGMVVVFLAIAAYFAVRAASERIAMQTSLARMAVMAVALLLLAGSWQIRAMGTIDSVRLRGEKVHREWLTDLQQRRTDYVGHTQYLRILDGMAQQGFEPAAPSLYPNWVQPILGEP
jgi:hypothetical protein